MKNKNTRIISTIYPRYFRYHRIRLVNTYDVRPQSYGIRRTSYVSTIRTVFIRCIVLVYSSIYDRV